MHVDVPFTEGSLGNGTFIFTVCGRLVLDEVQYTSLLTEGRTDTSRKLRKRVGGAQQLVKPNSQSPLYKASFHSGGLFPKGHAQ